MAPALSGASASDEDSLLPLRELKKLNHFSAAVTNLARKRLVSKALSRLPGPDKSRTNLGRTCRLNGKNYSEMNYGADRQLSRNSDHHLENHIGHLAFANLDPKSIAGHGVVHKPVELHRKAEPTEDYSNTLLGDAQSGKEKLGHLDIPDRNTAVSEPKKDTEVIEIQASKHVPRQNAEKRQWSAKECLCYQQLLQCRGQQLLQKLRKLQAELLLPSAKSQATVYVEQHRSKLLPGATTANTNLHGQSLQNAKTANSRHSSSLLAERQQTATGTLLSCLSHVESANDSDVTVSSSDSESDDETATLHSPVPASRHAPHSSQASKLPDDMSWYRDRAQIISRWTWLQTQVSDLEYNIRQQSNIHLQLRQRKGGIVLVDPPLSSASGGSESGHSTPVVHLPSFHNVNASRFWCSRQPVDGILTPAAPVQSHLQPTTHNHNISTIQYPLTSPAQMKYDQMQASMSPEQSVSRCCAVRPVRRRRLVRMSYRSAAASGLDRKHGRHLPTVANTCQCGADTCSEAGSARHRHSIAQMTAVGAEKCDDQMALLDHSYHSVLSFPPERSLNVLFDERLRQSDWQNPPSPQNVTADNVPTKAAKTESHRLSASYPASGLHVLSSTYRKKLERRLARSLTLPSRGSSPSTDTEQSAPTSTHTSHKRRRDAATLASAAISRQQESLSVELMDDMDVDLSSLSPDLSKLDGCLKKRKSAEDQYCIDKFVIPLHLAAPCKVEKLHYKEIVTPGWRKLSHSAMAGNAMLLTPEHNEDALTENLLARHAVCEAEEKRRFLQQSAASQQQHNSARRASADAIQHDTSEPVSNETSAALPVTSPAPLPPVPQSAPPIVTQPTPRIHQTSTHDTHNYQHHPVLHLSASQPELHPYRFHQSQSRLPLGGSLDRSMLQYASRSAQHSGSATPVPHASSTLTAAHATGSQQSHSAPWPARNFPLTDLECTTLALR